MAERKRSEGRLLTVPEGECWCMRSEVSGGPGMQSWYAELHEPLSTKYSPRWIPRCFFRFFSFI